MDNWTLFLDRDGVINKFSKDKYVNSVNDFEFCDGAIEAIRRLGYTFSRIIVVTNQQGVSLGFVKKEVVEEIHHFMLNEIRKGGGTIDRLYVCYDSPPSVFRKPEIGMALAAQKDFPEIDFYRSVMVGDSETDMKFGKALGMRTVFIGGLKEYYLFETPYDFENLVDITFSSLSDFSFDAVRVTL